MAARRVDPLPYQLAIVNPQSGLPTQFFMRVWDASFNTTNDVGGLLEIELIAGVGLTGGGTLGELLNITFDLEDTAVTPGTYGQLPTASQFQVVTFTVDQQGRLTAATESGNIDLFYDYAVFIPSKPTDGQLVTRLEVARAFTLPASLTGSQASARVASTGNVSFDIKRNGSSIGSVVFNVSASGTFTFASGVTFAAGDLLELVAPATADATLEDISITLVGTR